MKKRFNFLALIMTFCLLFVPTFAHSGRTDSSGGHKDNKNKSGLGYYHYHCGGYPAHLHTNGVCPYKSSNYTSTKSSVTTSNSSAHVTDPNKVTATLPEYSIYVNGQKIDNDYAKYPILNFNDITYFPLTWNYIQALGLSISIDTNVNITLNENFVKPTANIEIEKNYSKNSSSVSATKQSNVYFNSRNIATTETYPIINFRDIAYMPMTWDNNIEFDLLSSWDSETGFSISSNR